ncbi:MAG: signal recognition particle-docking protein FtsY, partial [Ilumatobacteraceae bacterium]
RTAATSLAPTAPPSAHPAAPPPISTAEEEVVVAETAALLGAEPERPNFRSRMSKARSALAGTLLGIRGRTGITQQTWDDLEEALLRADVGVRVTDDLLGGLRAKVKAKEITEPEQLLDALQEEMVGRLSGADRSLRFDATPGGPNVWLFVGVNGVGKTTTIGKVGAQQAALGRSVLMAAGDTFRAAAVEQLGTWAERSGAELVRGNEGGDPSAVIFDAIESATARHIDLVLGDTAGRLHTKTNLMEELRKVRRVAAKGAGRVTEVLLVIDATTGQNGLAQAREFGDATMTDGVGVTGVVLTKLDGSAKGGIVFAIETELGLPVKLVGLGESISDMVEFDPQEFIDALVRED